MGWVSIGLKLFPLVIGAVHAVERLVTARSEGKQDAAVETVRAMLMAVEGGLSRDLLDDQAVQDATRKLIDAYVALQNALASHRA